jgi:hypothetical protein
MGKGKTRHRHGPHSPGILADLRISEKAVGKWAAAKLGLREPQQGRSLSPEEIAAYAKEHGMTVSDPASPRRTPPVKLRERNSVARLLKHSRQPG